MPPLPPPQQLGQTAQGATPEDPIKRRQRFEAAEARLMAKEGLRTRVRELFDAPSTGSTAADSYASTARQETIKELLTSGDVEPVPNNVRFGFLGMGGAKAKATEAGGRGYLESTYGKENVRDLGEGNFAILQGLDKPILLLEDAHTDTFKGWATEFLKDIADVVPEIAEAAVGVGGAAGGAMLGAAAGSIVPGVGTAIGAGIGGVLGGLAGDTLAGAGRQLGSAMLPGEDFPSDPNATPAQQTADEALARANQLGERIPYGVLGEGAGALGAKVIGMLKAPIKTMLQAGLNETVVKRGVRMKGREAAAGTAEQFKEFGLGPPTPGQASRSQSLLAAENDLRVKPGSAGPMTAYDTEQVKGAGEQLGSRLDANLGKDIGIEGAGEGAVTRYHGDLRAEDVKIREGENEAYGEAERIAGTAPILPTSDYVGILDETIERGRVALHGGQAWQDAQWAKKERAQLFGHAEAPEGREVQKALPQRIQASIEGEAPRKPQDVKAAVRSRAAELPAESRQAYLTKLDGMTPEEFAQEWKFADTFLEHSQAAREAGDAARPAPTDLDAYRVGDEEAHDTLRPLGLSGEVREVPPSREEMLDELRDDPAFSDRYAESGDGEDLTDAQVLEEWRSAFEPEDEYGLRPDDLTDDEITQHYGAPADSKTQRSELVAAIRSQAKKGKLTKPQVEEIKRIGKMNKATVAKEHARVFPRKRLGEGEVVPAAELLTSKVAPGSDEHMRLAQYASKNGLETPMALPVSELQAWVKKHAKKSVTSAVVPSSASTSTQKFVPELTPPTHAELQKLLEGVKQRGLKVQELHRGVAIERDPESAQAFGAPFMVISPNKQTFTFKTLKEARARIDEFLDEGIPPPTKGWDLQTNETLYEGDPREAVPGARDASRAKAPTETPPLTIEDRREGAKVFLEEDPLRDLVAKMPKTDAELRKALKARPGRGLWDKKDVPAYDKITDNAPSEELRKEWLQDNLSELIGQEKGRLHQLVAKYRRGPEVDRQSAKIRELESYAVNRFKRTEELDVPRLPTRSENPKGLAVIRGTDEKAGDHLLRQTKDGWEARRVSDPKQVVFRAGSRSELVNGLERMGAVLEDMSTMPMLSIRDAQQRLSELGKMGRGVPRQLADQSQGMTNAHLARRLKKALDRDLDRVAGLEGARQGTGPTPPKRDTSGKFLPQDKPHAPWIPPEAAAALRRARSFSAEKRQALRDRRNVAMDKLLKKVLPRDLRLDPEQDLDAAVIQSSHKIVPTIMKLSNRERRQTMRALRRLSPEAGDAMDRAIIAHTLERAKPDVKSFLGSQEVAIDPARFVNAFNANKELYQDILGASKKGREAYRDLVKAKAIYQHLALTHRPIPGSSGSSKPLGFSELFGQAARLVGSPTRVIEIFASAKRAEHIAKWFSTPEGIHDFMQVGEALVQGKWTKHSVTAQRTLGRLAEMLWDDEGNVPAAMRKRATPVINEDTARKATLP